MCAQVRPVLIPSKSTLPRTTYELEHFERSSASCSHSYEEVIATDNLSTCELEQSERALVRPVLFPRKITFPQRPCAQRPCESEKVAHSGAPCFHSQQEHVATDNLLAGTV